MRIVATGYGSLGGSHGNAACRVQLRFQQSHRRGRGHSRSTASTIKFILQGADKTFTYTVTASEHGGFTYDFLRSAEGLQTGLTVRLVGLPK